MQTVTEITAVSETRMQEAETLHQANLYEGAIYLAGYSLELAFKAKICERLGIPNLFHEGFVQAYRKGVSGMEFDRASDFRRFFMVHDIAKLFLLSGLSTQYEQDKVTNPSLLTSWTCICLTKWSEQVRYELRGQRTEIESADFIKAIKTLSAWILSN